jgi:hypothetical protein
MGGERGKGAKEGLEMLKKIKTLIRGGVKYV